MTDSEYPNSLYLARISEKTGNYEEAIKYIEKILSVKKNDLTKEEKNILQAAYKHLFSELRSSWRTLCNVLDRESRQKNCNIRELVENLKNEIETEMNNLCNKILQLIDENLLNRVSNIESKIFYLKLKGDYNRYMIEYLKDENLKKEKIDIILNSYNEGLELSKKLSFTNEIKLGLILNFGVFYNDNLNDPINALNITSDIYEGLIKEIDNLDDKQYKIINNIANLLKENIDNWKLSLPELNNENTVEEKKVAEMV